MAPPCFASGIFPDAVFTSRLGLCCAQRNVLSKPVRQQLSSIPKTTSLGESQALIGHPWMLESYLVKKE